MLDRRRHKSPAVEWALYTEGGSELLTSSPRSEFTTLSLISSNEVCGQHEISPHLIQDLLENFSGRCWPRSPREIVLFRNSFQKIILPNWVHRRPFRQSWPGSSGISNFWPSIVTCRRQIISRIGFLLWQAEKVLLYPYFLLYSRGACLVPVRVQRFHRHYIGHPALPRIGPKRHYWELTNPSLLPIWH